MVGHVSSGGFSGVFNVGQPKLNLQSTPSMQRTQHVSFITATLRRWVLVCLMVTLPLCGFASAMTALLGAQHVHATRSVSARQAQVAPAAASTLWFDEAAFQPTRKPLFAHTAGAQAAHAHDSIQRHHHDDPRSNSSVLSLDGGTSYDAARAELNSATTKAAASLLPLLGWTAESALSDANTAHSPWGEAPRWSVQSAELRAAERPPKI